MLFQIWPKSADRATKECKPPVPQLSADAADDFFNWSFDETTFEMVSVFFKSVNVTFAVKLWMAGSLIVVLNSSSPPFFLAAKPSGNEEE